MPKTVDRELPADEHEQDRITSAGSPLDAAPRRTRFTSISRVSCDARSSSRTSVASSKKRGSSRVSFVRG